MTTDDSNQARIAPGELWRSAPWWERIIYLLAVLMFVLAFLVDLLSKHLPAAWVGDGTLNLRLPEIDVLLVAACFPLGGAAIYLATRRRSPQDWRFFWRLWSMRLIAVGIGFLLALGVWDDVVALSTPSNQIPPSLPRFLAVPAIVAASLTLVGLVLVVPELVVRLSRTKRQ